MINKFCI